jgi:pimeloyl-ACP methyl ester carboxylesterase
MKSPLFFRTLGNENNPALIILHGLLGTSDNWQTLGKEYGANFFVVLIDQRNHGRSPHFETHSYSELADDLRLFMDEQGIEKASILGHSMGGKTALMFAHEYPDRVQKLIIADMAPRAYTPHHQTVFDALLSAPILGAAERSIIEQHLNRHLADSSMTSFLMKGLRRDEKNGFSWRPNIKVLNDTMTAIVSEVPLSINTWPMLVIYGGQSNYVEQADLEQYEQSCMQLEVHRIPEAGHWLHASHPKEFFEITEAFLSA